MALCGPRDIMLEVEGKLGGGSFYLPKYTLLLTLLITFLEITDLLQAAYIAHRSLAFTLFSSFKPGFPTSKRGPRPLLLIVSHNRR